MNLSHRITVKESSNAAFIITNGCRCMVNISADISLLDGYYYEMFCMSTYFGENGIDYDQAYFRIPKPCTVGEAIISKQDQFRHPRIYFGKRLPDILRIKLMCREVFYSLRIIYTLCPITLRQEGNDALLKSCVSRVMDIAQNEGILKIGFPLEVRGINKDEKREIIKVAVNAVEEWMLDHPNNRSEVVLFGNRYDIDESKDLLSDYM